MWAKKFPNVLPINEMKQQIMYLIWPCQNGNITKGAFLLISKTYFKEKLIWEANLQP
jgi:membrane protease subunit (stomatin/prohibitin family)